MMQGDSYGIQIDILKSDGTAVTTSDVSDVEISIGSLKKTYASGEVSYSDGKWIMPVTQEETFGLPSAYVPAQVRVVDKNGNVEGVSLGEILIKESISKVVL